MPDFYSWKQQILGVVSSVLPGVKTSKSAHKEASGYLEQGRRKYNAKDYDSAEDLFRHAVMADPRYPLAHYYLGLCLYKRDKSEDALKAWERAVHAGPSTSAGMKAQKKINYAKGKMNSAIAELEHRVRKD